MEPEQALQLPIFASTLHGYTLHVSVSAFAVHDTLPHIQEILTVKKRSPEKDADIDRKRRKLTVRKKADLDLPTQALASSVPALREATADTGISGSDGAAAVLAADAIEKPSETPNPVTDAACRDHVEVC